MTDISSQDEIQNLATLLDRVEGRQTLPEAPIRVSLKIKLRVDLTVAFEVEIVL